MCVCARLFLLAALPALAGRAPWCAGGEVVSVTGGPGGGGPGGGGPGGWGPGGGGPAGGGPAFAPRTRTAAVAAVGQAVTLDCRVLRLGDKSVSWVRSRDLQILTHAGTVFTADTRVSAAETRGAAGGASPSVHSLRIERLRVADAGRYECQVNTEPKMSLFFNLTVLDEPVPTVVVSVVERRSVRGALGGAATLACEARYDPPPRALPLPPLDIRWRRADAPSPLSLQSSRGGISLDTERWSARVVSRLTLADLRAEDAGAYACAAGDATATLHLKITDQEEHMEMQRDQSESGAGATWRATGCALLPALAFIATARVSVL